MPLDYKFTQNLINFGRQLAGDIVGQPFQVYRLQPASNGNYVQASNLFNADLRAKITHSADSKQIENEVQHASMFQFLCSFDAVQIGDILVQVDDVFGQNGTYAVASFRPLKQIICARVETYAYLKRPQSNKDKGYGGPSKDTHLPFILLNGKLVVGSDVDSPSVIPCGLNTIGQIKTQKPEHLPMGLLTPWYYIYIPMIPGVEAIRENDIVEVPAPAGDSVPPASYPTRYRINTPYFSPVGTAGVIALCERLTI